MKFEDNSVAMVIVAFVLFYLFSSTPKTEDKVIYFSYCSDLKHNVYNCPQGENIFVQKQSFKINFERQLVVSDGIFMESKLPCVIFDKDNWRCKADYMIDGRYGDDFILSGSIDKDGKKSYLPVYNQVGWIGYWIHYLKGFLK